MARKRDIRWHTGFLRLVEGGVTFKAAAGELGVSTATLSEHFRADRAFHAEAKRLRGKRLHGPAPDLSWHPRLPPLLAGGLSIPQAARRIGRTAITIRAHLKRYPGLRAAVEAARTAGSATADRTTGSWP